MVNSHQRWKQTRLRVCFHLWCELTNTMNVTEWRVSRNSCNIPLNHRNYTREATHSLGFKHQATGSFCSGGMAGQEQPGNPTERKKTSVQGQTSVSGEYFHISWIPWNLSFRYILFHEKKTPNDAVTSQCQSQFTPKMKANAVPRLLSSLVWIDQYNQRNGMTSFMEFMRSEFYKIRLDHQCRPESWHHWLV